VEEQLLPNCHPEFVEGSLDLFFCDDVEQGEELEVPSHSAALRAASSLRMTEKEK
jgi:hypothetical protein